MSMHDFSLISPPSSHDHFPSAFLQGFPPSAFDSLSTTPLERFLQPDHDRRMVDLPPFMPRQPPARTYPFEYMNTPIAPPRPLSGFDPRPPHAGWTPKEEVDEDAQTRELLARASASPAETPTPGEMPGADSTPLRKMYSFISLPGNAVRKRPRRRYDEIERLYACAWPGCDKAYGTLNHLNAHVNMQRHGAKRSPAEFKELREQWRKQKKLELPAGRRRRVAVRPAAAADDGPSPASSGSDSATTTYWPDAPLSPVLLPPLSRLDAGSMLLQPLHAVTLAASLGRESPEAHQYDEYGRRDAAAASFGSRSAEGEPQTYDECERRDEYRRRWTQ